MTNCFTETPKKIDFHILNSD
eukprot:UN08251